MYIRTPVDLVEAPKSYTSRSYIGEIRQKPASVSQPIRLTMRTLPFLVLDRFRFNKYSLSKSNQDKVRFLAHHVVESWRTLQPIRTVRLVGHSDPVGTEDYNLKLGSQRAIEVQKWLIGAVEGLKPGLMNQINIVVESRGKSVPVASNRTTEGRARNRRVEAFISTEAIAPPGPTPTTPPPPRIPSPAEVAKGFVPPGPETPEERLQLILTTPSPTLPRGKSIDEMLDSALSRVRPSWLRPLIKKAAMRGFWSVLDYWLNQAELGNEEKEAIRATLRAVMKTPLR